MLIVFIMAVVFYLNLENRRRELNTVPPVCSTAYHLDHPALEYQVVRGVQICFRFSGRRDSCTMEIDGKRRTGRYPHLLVKRPGELHRIPEPDSGTAFYFTYAAELLEELRRCGLEDDIVFCELPEAPELNAIFRRIQELAGKSEEFGAADRIDMLCFQMLQEVLLIRKQRSRAPVSWPDEKIRRIASYLRLNLMREIDLDELARESGFSYRTFSRHWKQAGYPPPVQFLFELRMEEAKRLLAETVTPIREIAARIHYQGCAWFCAAFRRHTGTTPLQYRRRFQRRRP